MSKRIDQLAVALADFVIRFRWLVILISIFLVALAGSGAKHLAFANNYRTFFSDENPELIAFEKFQDTYTKNDNILFILQPADGAVFSPRIAEAIEWLTEESWQLPYVTRVDSVSNFQHSWADGDDLTVEDLVRDGATLSMETLAEKQAIALAEPLLRNNLISHDADTTGINVTLHYPEESLAEVPETVAVARQIVADARERYPDVTIALSGLSMLNNAFTESGQKDAMTLVPIMYAILIVTMIVTLRSFSGSFITLIIIGFSTITAMGFAGHVGIKLSPISVTAPTIILTLAIADSIHILVTLLKLMRHGMAKREALRESIRVNAIPVSITSLTTVIGFLSLNFTDTPPFWHLGNITAVGITSAWFFSMTLLPAVASLLPFRVKARADDRPLGLERAIDAYALFVTRHYKRIGFAVGIPMIGLAALAPTVELNDEWVKYFDHRIQFRTDSEFGMEHLTGLYRVEFSVEAGEEGGISNPDYLTRLDAFTGWLREQPEVTHVFSYTDIIKRLNKNMHGDDASWYAIPQDRDLAAQYLLLYELSLPFGLDLNDRINVDKSATRVTVTLPEVSTAKVRAFLDESRGWLQANTPPAMHADPTSATVMFAFIAQRNIEGMLGGNAIALGLIACVLVGSLRSWKLGLLSLIPNTLPIVVTFGIWAILSGMVGMAAATVTSTSLGIIVDDTVHFLAKYLRARREEGMNAEAAVRYAFNTVGVAIVLTTVILTFGFGFLATSTFAINAQMGLLTSIAIGVALVFDFTILPVLLILLDKNPAEATVMESVVAS